DACAMEFLRLTVGGPYTIGPASSTVEGATEVDYGFAFRRLTPLAEPATGLVAACGSGSPAVGDELDVSDTGCAAIGIPSVPDCPTEHDLNALRDGVLFFGDRSSDLCEARPSALAAFGVARR